MPPETGSSARNLRDEDLIIFDRWAPAAQPAPARDLRRAARRSRGCPAPSAGAQRAWDATEEKRPRWEMAGTHPVVQGVDPLTLKIEKARPYGAAG